MTHAEEIWLPLGPVTVWAGEQETKQKIIIEREWKCVTEWGPGVERQLSS